MVGDCPDLDWLYCLGIFKSICILSIIKRIVSSGQGHCIESVRMESHYCNLS